MGKAHKQPVHSLSSSLSLFEKLVRLRAHETYGSSPPSGDELIDGLRHKYPEYCRLKPQPFTRMVKQILNSYNNKNKQKLRRNNIRRRSAFYLSSSRTPANKKAKISDIQTLETEKHVACSQIEVDSESSESDYSSDDVKGCISAGLTSDDEDFKLPKFDLTKSLLRRKNSALEIAKSLKKPENVEFELGTDSHNKEKKKDDHLVMKDNTIKPNNVYNDDGGVVCGKHNGPRFKDIGGMDALLDELTTDVLAPLCDPDVPLSLGVTMAGNPGILLHGPPGCGKTKLAHAIANEAGVPFYKISATDLISGVSGASEENIRELFSKAHKTAPSIVFIDEIDAIASKRENLQREMERRIATQLMTCIDNTSKSEGKPGYVLVIGATNRPDALDPALRRPGRFDREIALGVPDENARMQILSALAQNLRLEGVFNLVKISRSTPGFVAADLAALVSKASNLAWCRVIVGRKLELSTTDPNEYWWKTDADQNGYWWSKASTPEEKANVRIMMSDFEEAAKLVQPSLKREGFSSIPTVKWEDVGGLDLLRREFHTNIVRRIKLSNVYEEDGVDTETGFLLYGPPGCGKTLIAKAVANEAGANFIHIQGPELLNKYVGESELALRTIFSRARTCSPCILFFDEIDALTPARGKEGGWVVDRLVNQLLIELDGGDQRKGVYVIGAINRPEVMDRALLRPGRFGKLMYVPLPNEDERGLILKALSRNKRLDADVDLMAIARSEACVNFSGADLSHLMKEATNAAFEEKISKIEAIEAAAAYEGTSGSSSQSYAGGMPLTIKAVHFEQVLGNMSPSVSNEEKQYYDLSSERFGASNKKKSGSNRS